MPTEEQNLGNGLILRPVRDAADAERYIALNAAVTDEGMIAERLLYHHPETSYADYLLVVDEATGEAVSTTCLLPWRCDYEEITLNVAMLEMVITHPGYRQRGLVRAQIDYFHRLVEERGFDLSIIQGIPYYYRQFGYAYALDHTPRVSLPNWRIPAGAATPSPLYRLRPATPDDLEALTQFYRLAMAKSQLSVQRSAAYWRYLLQQMAYPVRLIEDVRTGQPAGYLCVYSSDRLLKIQESAQPHYDVGLAVLRQLATETSGEIQIAGPPGSLLVRLATTFGATPLQTYQWLWRITEVGALLNKIKPALEHRLADSAGAGFSGSLCLNLYRRAYALNFDAGKLTIEALGFVDASLGADGGDLCLPPEAFIRLLLGYRHLDQLQDAWPDIEVKPEHRYLFEILFPPLSAEILMPY